MVFEVHRSSSKFLSLKVAAAPSLPFSQLAQSVNILNVNYKELAHILQYFLTRNICDNYYTVRSLEHTAMIALHYGLLPWLYMT